MRTDDARVRRQSSFDARTTNSVAHARPKPYASTIPLRFGALARSTIERAAAVGADEMHISMNLATPLPPDRQADLRGTSLPPSASAELRRPRVSSRAGSGRPAHRSSPSWLT